MTGAPRFRKGLATALNRALSPTRDLASRGANGRAERLAVTPKRLLKSVIRRAISWYVEPRFAEAVHAAEALRAAETLDIGVRERNADTRIDSQEVNLELLKAELHSVNRNLEALHRGVDAMALAIAPTAGLAGVADRLSEFRERLNAVERRTREMPARSAGTEAASDPAILAPVLTDEASSPIDYVGFERRFRGDPAAVQATIRERYLEILRQHGPVLDVGCGKGELVETLRDEGVAAIGIDLDHGMVDEARERGLDVHRADLNEFLQSQPPESFGSIISTQVVEHLQVEVLVRFLQLSRERLAPGGVFIAETPNPASLIVLGTHFILDPTHVRPIHPSLMVYLCEAAGFSEIELRFFEPATAYHLPHLDEDPGIPQISAINEAFASLNHTLFGPQDYAVLARVRA